MRATCSKGGTELTHPALFLLLERLVLKASEYSIFIFSNDRLLFKSQTGSGCILHLSAISYEDARVVELDPPVHGWPTLTSGSQGEEPGVAPGSVG